MDISTFPLFVKYLYLTGPDVNNIQKKLKHFTLSKSYSLNIIKTIIMHSSLQKQ